MARLSEEGYQGQSLTGCAAQSASTHSQPKAALDNTTKSATPPQTASVVTGVISSDYDPVEKWHLQAVARRALGDKHRINVCMRHVRADRREVDVRRSGRSGRAYYSGLMACGCVWTCPVCAPKIQAVRTQEVRAAIDAWEGHVLLLTQTVPHQRTDKLEKLLGRFTDALRKFKQGSNYKRLSERYAISGSIRALEVTDGLHGWHPHAHTILFIDAPDVPLRDMEKDLFRLWESATRRAGVEGKVSPSAFKLQDGKQVKAYVTKMGAEWGPEHELVRAHSKRGHGESHTPFDMLRNYEPKPSCGRYLARFAEYANNFHGRRQLVWSDGLKKRLLGTEGLTDQQVADSIGEKDVILAQIPLEDWIIIRKNNLQGHVLQIVNEFGKEGLQHLLSVYRET